MKKVKNTISMLLVVLLIMSMIPISANAYLDPGIGIITGKCTSGCGTTLRCESGMLVLKGWWCGQCCRECGGRNGNHNRVNIWLWGLISDPCPSRPNTSAIGIYNATDIQNIRDKVFCAITYASTFQDLRNAFGDGRTQASADKLWNHFRTYALSGKEPARLNGFSPVFRANHYLGTYADLRHAAWVNNGNNTGALLHFIRFGMDEARSSHPSFNVQNYRSRYVDLQNAFGNQWALYYRHYVRFGLSEGRNAT